MLFTNNCDADTMSYIVYNDIVLLDVSVWKLQPYVWSRDITDMVCYYSGGQASTWRSYSSSCDFRHIKHLFGRFRNSKSELL